MSESTAQAAHPDSDCPICQRRVREVVPVVNAYAFILTGDWDTLHVSGLRFWPCGHQVGVAA